MTHLLVACDHKGLRKQLTQPQLPVRIICRYTQRGLLPSAAADELLRTTCHFRPVSLPMQEQRKALGCGSSLQDLGSTGSPAWGTTVQDCIFRFHELQRMQEQSEGCSSHFSRIIASSWSAPTMRVMSNSGVPRWLAFSFGTRQLSTFAVALLPPVAGVAGPKLLRDRPAMRTPYQHQAASHT